jgi:hypothetical protein
MTFSLPAVNWGSLAPYIIALWTPALAVLAAYLAHLWDDRSKRAEFRREKRWKRKFKAYKELYHTLDLLEDILTLQYGIVSGAVAQQLDGIKDQFPKDMPEGAGKAALHFSAAMQQYEFMVAATGHTTVADATLTFQPPSIPPKPEELLAYQQRLTGLLYRSLTSATSEHGRAMTAAKFLGMPDQLRELLAEAWNMIQEMSAMVPAAPGPSAAAWEHKTTALSKLLEHISDVIEEDLEATAAGEETPEVVWEEPERSGPIRAIVRRLSRKKSE